MQNSQNSTYAKLNNLIEIEGLTSSLAAHASSKKSKFCQRYFNLYKFKSV